MLAVGNRIRSEADQRFLTAALPELVFAGFIPYDERLSDAERAGRPAAGASAAADAAVAAVVTQLEAHVQRDAVP
jgi:CO dehydrogenase nickel-insertion accessory protein CooC1